MNDVLGIVISKESYDEYLELKRKNTPMKKIHKRNYHCPVCDYVVD